MTDNPEPQPVDPALVKYLRFLVTTLSATMIIGLVVIIGLLVTRFSGTSAPAFPDRITLPDGTVPIAVTKGDGWYAIVTKSNEIMVFDADTGKLRQTIQITTQP
ncbi:DUF6476 family protein [Roseovarius aestuariivivens]|uniref:DUF6476 family protein n=1 Tax=Roseovarius aestuariivivens TaxID=1888910 RepID=UPI0010809AA7|nr:DUF6476 family protein [Roseovarius aestuariivivens]